MARTTRPLDELARCSRTALRSTALRFASCAAHVPDRHPGHVPRPEPGRLNAQSARAGSDRRASRCHAAAWWHVGRGDADSREHGRAARSSRRASGDHQIFQTETTGGPIYLGVSTFIGSTSYAGQSIKAIRINGEKLDTDAKVIKTSSGIKNSVGFAFDFFTVVDHPERPVTLFSYNEANKSFRFPVVIEDKRTPQGRVTSKFITYRFDGKYFVKVS